jgi:cytochrome c peroxidase
MTSNPSSNEGNAAGRSDALTPSGTSASGQEYKVGPGRPPKEFRFKPGQSGNPKGAKRKLPSIAMDIKALFDAAFNKKVTIKEGERERIITRTDAGFEQLSIQFAKGDRYARRDSFWIAEKFGSDLMAGRHKTTQEALASNYQAILDAYVTRQYDKVVLSSPVLAPPELLDDDSEDQNRK